MTFVKKNTTGGTAGRYWEAGEVKEVNSYLAEELVALSPEDFEIVSEPVAFEVVPESTTEEPVEEDPAEPEQNETPVAAPVKAKRVYNKKTATETPSAE
jgi:hypothetical protein